MRRPGSDERSRPARVSPFVEFFRPTVRINGFSRRLRSGSPVEGPFPSDFSVKVETRKTCVWGMELISMNILLDLLLLTAYDQSKRDTNPGFLVHWQRAKAPRFPEIFIRYGPFGPVG